MTPRPEYNLPIDVPRCCYESFMADPIREPSEGVEFACHHCMDTLRFVNGAWRWYPFVWLGPQEKIEP